MADDRDDGSQSDSPGRDRLSLGGSEAGAFLGGAAIGALFGGAVGYFLLRFASGDEPPIRVKGGSMEFQLLSTTMYWKSLGSRQWKISNGTRANAYYQASIVVQSSTKCPSQEKKGETVTVTHSDGAWVELKATGNHTRLRSSVDLELSDGDRLLTYCAKGHISKIEIEDLDCRLNSGELQHMLLMDY